MPNTTRNIWREGFDRLKKTLERITRSRKEQHQPQYALQPVRNRPTGLPPTGRG